MRCAAALICTLVLLSNPLAAQSDEGEPPQTLTLVDHFKDRLAKIRFQMTNANSKLRGGAVTMGDSDSSQAGTPGRRCCGDNIDLVEAHLEAMVGLWKDLQACYQSAGDAEGEVQLNFVRADAGTLVGGLQGFKAAGEGDVEQAMATMIKAYFLLQKSIGKLPECGEPVLR